MKLARRLGLLTMLAATVLLVLGACGGDDPTPTAAPKAAAPQAAEPAKPAAPAQGPDITLENAAALYGGGLLTFEELDKFYDDVVIPAAIAEGEVTWYSCHSDADALKIIGSFNDEYPDITVGRIQAAPGALIERITAEQNANKVVADVYNCGGTSGRILGWRGGGVKHLVPNAIDPSRTWAGQLDPSDSERLTTVFGYLLGGININTDLVPQSEYPDSWWDIVNKPFWRQIAADGLMAIGNPFGPGYMATFEHIWMNDSSLGENYIAALSALKPVIIPRGGADAVARGEMAILIGAGAAGPYVALKGAPITYIAPREGVWATAFLSTLVKGAPNPNAAHVFSNWLISAPTQVAVSQFGMTPIDDEVELAVPEVSIEGLKIPYWSTSDTERIIATYYEWAREQGYWQ